MDEKKPPIVPLILQQNKNKVSHEKPRPYQFGADTYERYINRKNPFLDRVLKSAPTPLQLDSQQVQALFQHLKGQAQYQIAYSTERPPHQKRKIATPITNTPQKETDFVNSQKLKEDSYRLGFAIQTFFKSVLGRLQNDVGELPLVVNELVPLFLEHHIKIKIYDAYRSFYNEEQFLATLEKISEEEDIENFEFFCSALFGYYSQFQ